VAYLSHPEVEDFEVVKDLDHPEVEEFEVVEDWDQELFSGGERTVLLFFSLEVEVEDLSCELFLGFGCECSTVTKSIFEVESVFEFVTGSGSSMKKILTSKRKRTMVVRIYCLKKREGKEIHTISMPNTIVCISNNCIHLPKLTGS